MLRLLLRLCVVILVGSVGWAQSSSTLLIGGERAGSFSLGAPFSSVVKVWGQPPDVFPSSADPGTSTRMYKKQKVAFLVNREDTIIGITVARSDWKTQGGLGVGSPVQAFQKAFGQGLKRGANDLAFAAHGLAVTHAGGTVTTVYVVKRDEVDRSKGDHLLVGGNRAGEIRLGNSSQDLKALLGPPARTEGPSQNIWIYPQQGVTLGFVKGRLSLIGVTSGDWVTPGGLKVGRPFSEMKRELGKEYRIEKSSVFYDRWGIGARLEGETIAEILIFPPRQSGGQG